MIENDVVTPPPTSLELFIFFSRIGLTSFGGGIGGWLLREICQNKKWVSEAEFLDAYNVCQALPGINAMNIAIWMGYRLGGTLGSISGVAGVFIPPAIVIIFLNVLFAKIMQFSIIDALLTGLAAAAIAMPLSVGIASAKRLRRAVPLLLTAMTFVAIGFLHLPLIWVVLGGAAIGITDVYLLKRRTA